MKTIGRTFSILAALSLSPLVLAACDGDGASGPNADVPDAAQLRRPDPRPPAPDAGPSAPMGTVRLLYRPAHHPTGAITAFLEDSNGTPAGTVPISAGELGQLRVPIGGTLTVGYQVGDQWFLDTVADLNDGDSIVLGGPRPIDALIGGVQMTLPGPFDGAKRYQIDGTCPGPDEIADPTVADFAHLGDYCEGAANTWTLLGRALDGNARTIAYTLDAGVTLKTGTIAPDAWRTDFLDGKTGMAKLPAGAESVTAAIFASNDGDVSRFHCDTETGALPTDESPQLTSFHCPDGFTREQLEYSVAFDAEGLSESNVIVSRALRPENELDATTALLPRISAPELRTNSIHIGHVYVDFQADGPIDGADGMFVQIHGGRVGAWNLFLPARRGVWLPAFEGTDAQAAIGRAIGSGAIGMTVELVDSDRIDGFTALRAVPMMSFGYLIPRPAGDFRIRETSVTTK